MRVLNWLNQQCHSRESRNPFGWIPAFAGMTGEEKGMTGKEKGMTGKEQGISKSIKCFVVLFLFLNINAYAKDKTQTTLDIYTEDQLAITVTKDKPTFSIKLKANPSTGYSWFLREYDPNMMKPLKYEVLPPEKKLTGAPGYEVWTFHMAPQAFIVPQQTMIRFVYVRPWSSNDQIKQIAFRISSE